ncbi:pyridoxal-dependent decarboxylase [Rapidithrix thailandica]|uniref:Pyridoxal-dependent decarboxylase n=1 Tax=Rapidithrix thailandica TaxID=413964 RepID=A0AAW9SF74_9BACT
MKYWRKLTHKQICDRVFGALDKNVNFRTQGGIGVPASYLDTNVFYDNASFLKDAPFLKTLIENPNHIGCHTLGDSEAFFAGTQEIEKELIKLCAEDLLKGEPGAQDGYVATGGTEANIQAAWIYRNFFMKEYGAKISEIGILSSEDSHYSVPKGANLLNIKWYQAEVDFATRQLNKQALQSLLEGAKANGVKYMIVVANMATTMFGSVDNLDIYVEALEAAGLSYKIHVDGAFGGFIYPVSNPNNPLSFQNKHITSFTMDAHKMAQAPYGTGIFLIRKDYIHYVYTQEAQYVSGLDITLCGSRSGANAVSVWMILMTYGPFGWLEKINKLLYRTSWLCEKLDELGITYYRDPYMNIVTILSEQVPDEIAHEFGLVPDSHSEQKQWYKVVIMDHVELDALDNFTQTMARINK